MATIKAILNTQYQSKDGRYQIVIRIRNKDRRRLYDTGYKASEAEWDDDLGLVNKKHPDRDLCNKKIKSMILQAKQYDLNCEVNSKHFSFDEIFKQEDDGDFTAFIQRQAQAYAENSQPSSKVTAEYLYEQLTEWKGKVYYSDLTVESVRRFDMWLKNDRGNKVNTRVQKILILAGYYNKAVRQVGAPPTNPFEAYCEEYKLKREKVAKDVLTAEDIVLLENVKQLTRRRRRVRDMFLLSYYVRGIRYANVLMMKKSDLRDNRVYWVAVKGKQPANQYIHTKLAALLDRYKDTAGEYLFFTGVPPKGDSELFEFIKANNRKDNNMLKRIAKDAGIKKHVSFHTSRRTFANHFRRTTGDMHAVQAALTHSEYRTTEIYLQDYMQEDLDAKLKTIYK